MDDEIIDLYDLTGFNEMCQSVSRFDEARMEKLAMAAEKDAKFRRLGQPVLIYEWFCERAGVCPYYDVYCPLDYHHT